jgi:hypothetical protein
LELPNKLEFSWNQFMEAYTAALSATTNTEAA